MNVIQNGKRYNTDSAKLLAAGADNVNLYQKKTGEYFLCDERRVRSLTTQQAQEWAEKRLTAEECGRLFGEAAEQGVQLCLKINGHERRILREAAKVRGVSVSDMVRELIAGLEGAETPEIF